MGRLRVLWKQLLWTVGIGRPPFVEVVLMGVPNLVQVAPRFWRMGQPVDPFGWNYLPTRVGPAATIFKLNDDTTGVDHPPEGWTLVKRPLPPEDDQPWTVVVVPPKAEVRAIVDEIVMRYRRGETIVIHCVHGRDRTGLIVALVGMRLFGWSKRQAWRNMIEHGFRWELPGLDAYFAEVA